MAALGSSLILTMAALWNAPCETPESVRVDRELLIDQSATVASPRAAPGGPWHFATLIREMLPAGASDAEVADVILGWLRSYDVDQRLVPDPERPAGVGNPERALARREGVWAEIAAPWLARSGGSLDLAKAPFKLLAIVNRMDVRDPAQCRTAAGEGRFVFVAMNPETEEPLNFTVIFEYDLPTDARDAVAWARAWHGLSALPCDSTETCETFNAALENLTRAFSTRADGLSLAQIRTNDILSFPGELRELHLTPAGRIETATLSMTPDLSHARDEPLGAWILANRDAVMAERFTLPGAFAGFSGLYPRRTQWRFANVEDEELRFHFSKSTCNGCHTFEHPRVEDIDGTYHISPRGEVSGYLTLEELPRRQAEACRTLAQASCTDARFELAPAGKAKIRTH